MKNFIRIALASLIAMLLIFFIIDVLDANDEHKTEIERKYNYSINHFVDTIDNHIILSTVCNYDNNISISTLELNNNDTINVR